MVPYFGVFVGKHIGTYWSFRHFVCFVACALKMLVDLCNLRHLIGHLDAQKLLPVDIGLFAFWYFMFHICILIDLKIRARLVAAWLQRTELRV